MKKFKIFLIGLFLIAFSSTAFAAKKKIPKTKNIFLNEDENKAEEYLNAENLAIADAIEQIDLFGEIKEKLKKEKIITLDAKGKFSFNVINNDVIQTINYEKFINYTIKNVLTYKLKRILKLIGKIDFSKLIINLPENCIIKKSNGNHDYIVEAYITFRSENNAKSSILKYSIFKC